jgi:hypothetical protein
MVRLPAGEVETCTEWLGSLWPGLLWLGGGSSACAPDTTTQMGSVAIQPQALAAQSERRGLVKSAWPKFHGDLGNTGRGSASGATGTERWEATLSVVIGSPAIGVDGTVYVPHGAGLTALDGRTGAKRWEFEMFWATGTPAISADGTVYVGSMGLVAAGESWAVPQDSYGIRIR